MRAEVIEHVADMLVGVPIRRPLRVAVDGITASGKTTFARELSVAVQRRDRPCVHVSMDGFHQPRAVRYQQGRESADGYYDDAYNFEALKQALLVPLGPGGDGRYRTAVLDLHTDQPADAPFTTAPANLIVIVDGSFLHRYEVKEAWDVTIFLSAGFELARSRGVERDAALLVSVEQAERLFDTRYHAAQRRYLIEVDPAARADIVVDHDDPRHPRVTYVAADLTRLAPHLRRTRAFFAPRAATWNDRFPEDDEAFAAAVDELQPRTGGVAVDLGCGTGRASPHLRRGVGASGAVICVDVTREMLRVARDGHGDDAAFVLADALSLPVRAGTVDAIFAAGLVTHVPDPRGLFEELARIARRDCRLALFHPVGRVARARRHRRTLRPDELLDPSVLPDLLAATGWRAERIDDAEDRYLALARRASCAPPVIRYRGA